MGSKTTLYRQKKKGKNGNISFVLQRRMQLLLLLLLGELCHKLCRELWTKPENNNSVMNFWWIISWLYYWLWEYFAHSISLKDHSSHSLFVCLLLKDPSIVEFWAFMHSNIRSVFCSLSSALYSECHKHFSILFSLRS